MRYIQVPNGAPIKAWIEGVPVEDEAMAQLYNIARLPFIWKHVAAMPDMHKGAGATVGSVIATRGAVVPAACGVDIGCGMFAEKTALRAEDLPDDLHGLRCAIEAAIPHGRSANGGQGDVGAWEYIPMHVMAYNNISGLMVPRARLGEKFENRWTNENVLRQFGTLGGGNHFVEVSIDENGDVWILLHSGSRGIGHALASAYIERAQASLEKYFVKLPD